MNLAVNGGNAGLWLLLQILRSSHIITRWSHYFLLCGDILTAECTECIVEVAEKWVSILLAYHIITSSWKKHYHKVLLIINELSAEHYHIIITFVITPQTPKGASFRTGIITFIITHYHTLIAFVATAIRRKNAHDLSNRSQEFSPLRCEMTALMSHYHKQKKCDNGIGIIG